MRKHKQALEVLSHRDNEDRTFGSETDIVRYN